MYEISYEEVSNRISLQLASAPLYIFADSLISNHRPSIFNNWLTLSLKFFIMIARLYGCLLKL